MLARKKALTQSFVSYGHSQERNGDMVSSSMNKANSDYRGSTNSRDCSSSKSNSHEFDIEQQVDMISKGMNTSGASNTILPKRIDKKDKKKKQPKPRQVDKYGKNKKNKFHTTTKSPQVKE